MNIVLEEEAKDDLFKGVKFYESQLFGLGDYFYNSIISDIKSLHLYCGIHRKINGYFRLLSKRFPYTIYYKFDKNNIYIFAILDCRSNPKDIEKRLS